MKGLGGTTHFGTAAVVMAYILLSPHMVTETFLGDTTQHRELAKGDHETSRYLDNSI